MIVEEFSTEFDILYNNITSNQAPGLDEYEKSVFLTMAQEELIKSYFNPIFNKGHHGFDSNEKRQYDFSTLVTVANLDKVPSADLNSFIKLDNRSILHKFPDDYFLSINEVIVDSDDKKYSVLSLTHDDYQKVLLKPYSLPTKRTAWRLITNSTADSTPLLEIITNFTGDFTYKMRYVKKPSPIIISNLTSEGLKIRGEETKTECKLPSEMHPEILQRAVELAKASYTGTLNDVLTIGNLSVTEKGVVPSNSK